MQKTTINNGGEVRCKLSRSPVYHISEINELLERKENIINVYANDKETLKKIAEIVNKYGYHNWGSDLKGVRVLLLRKNHSPNQEQST